MFASSAHPDSRLFRPAAGFRKAAPHALLPALLLAVLLAACGEDAGPALETTVETQPAPPPERLELAGAARGRNVLLLTLDTVRADRLNTYGYQLRQTSPRIDALLAGGATFERAIAPRALTWPTLASVFTGLYPSGHGVLENGFSLAEGVGTLAQRFSDAGYVTAAFLGNMCGAEWAELDVYSCTAGQDGKVVERAAGWLEQRGREGAEEPFFLWVHLFAAHGPYYNGGDRADELDPGYEGTLGPKKWRLDRVMTEEVELSPRDVQYLDALYDAAIIGTDGSVGRVLDALESAVPGESTLTVFLSDHGEDLYDHNGYLYHACSVYQSGLHVPFGISAPGILPGGIRVAQPVELVDVAPTLLELTGLPPLAESHGVSLLPYLERLGRGGGAGRPAFSEYGDTRIHTVQADGWKLVFNPDGVTPYCMAGAPEGHYPIAEVELYDLEADPLELNNLARREEGRVVRMAQLIEQRFTGLAKRQGEQDMSPELRDQLRALGYIAN